MNERYRMRNRNVAYYTLSVILGTLTLAYGSVPFYKMVR